MNCMREKFRLENKMSIIDLHDCHKSIYSADDSIVVVVVVVVVVVLLLLMMMMIVVVVVDFPFCFQKNIDVYQNEQKFKI